MYLTQNQLLETIIVAGLILMFIWWGFKSGFFGKLFWIIILIVGILFILNVYNYVQTIPV